MLDKYFVYDTNSIYSETGIFICSTEAEAKEYARKCIAYCLGDDGWSDEVKYIKMGIITSKGKLVTHKATQVDKKRRPPESEINENGDDQDGISWEDWACICDYKMLPVKDVAGQRCC